MHVLHHSFSLSACPKCHLLICQHTSLANLDFNPNQLQPLTECTDPSLSTPPSDHLEITGQRRSFHGMNFYIIPSSTADHQHSWTTFGTDSVHSSNTLDHSDSDNETLSDNIPFAQENLMRSSLFFTPTFNQIVRTQSENCNTRGKQPRSLTRSFSISTIHHKSSSLSIPAIKHEDSTATKSTRSSCQAFAILTLIISSFLITNTLDIVLLYIYYHLNAFNLAVFLSAFLLCDIILWINNLVQFKTTPSYLLFIPFILRFYLLYELVDSFTILFERTFLKTSHRQISGSSSSSSTSSSTTTTLEINVSHTMDSPILSHSDHGSSEGKTRQQLYYYLALFYLVHSGLLGFANLYLWSNHFEPSTESRLNMDSFLPEWILTEPSVGTPMNLSSIPDWFPRDNERQQLARRTLASNWTGSLLTSHVSLSVPMSPSSAFVLTSILYHVLINHSLLSTLLVIDRSSSLSLLLTIISRLCLMTTRLYALVFLFRLNAWWLPTALIVVHLTLMITLLVDPSKFAHKQHTMFIQIIFSLVTHSSIDDRSINTLISLENLSIFLHSLYLETFAFHSPTRLRLIIFITILIALQVIGFLCHIVSKNLLDRTPKKTTQI